MARRSSFIPSYGNVRNYKIHILGAPGAGSRDLYHALLRIPWWGALVVIVGGYLTLNVVFAAIYRFTGGVVNAAPDSFLDAFFFSIQTMGTIGYGSMYPATRLANTLVVAESVTGLVATALATGLVFVRFSLTRGRVMFSRKVALGLMDGVPTLMIRVGNERSNTILDAVFRMVMTRTTRTTEGVVIYRTHDLLLVRERAHSLTRSWTILHRIEPGSPLYGDTPETLRVTEVELMVTLVGTDDTSLQPVHALHAYDHADLAWGTRLADVLSEDPNGDMVLDLRRFHDLTPMEATSEFPYPRSAKT